MYKKNIFTEIINKSRECAQVFEDEEVLAFKDIYPDEKVHVLVIPKSKIIDFSDLVTNYSDQLSSFFQKVHHVAQTVLQLKDYTLRINVGDRIHVPHLHVHVLGGGQIKKD